MKSINKILIILCFISSVFLINAGEINKTENNKAVNGKKTEADIFSEYWKDLPSTLIKTEKIELNKEQVFPYIEHLSGQFARYDISLDKNKFNSIVKNYSESVLNLIMLEHKYKDYSKNEEDIEKRYFNETTPDIDKRSVHWRKGEMLKQHKANLYKTIQDKIYSEAEISDNDVTEYYNENKSNWYVKEKVEVYHVMIEPDDKTSWKQAETLAEKVYEKIKNGEELSKFAEKYNKRQSKNVKGYLGTFERGGLIPELDEACWKMVPDHLNEPALVKSPKGWHVVMITEYKQGKQKSLDQVKDKIIKSIKEERTQNVFEDLLSKSGKESKEIINKYLVI